MHYFGDLPVTEDATEVLRDICHGFRWNMFVSFCLKTNLYENLVLIKLYKHLPETTIT